ncbi:MAG TPA: hypothetical protein VKT74_00330, partial [Gammaproteobacteria bacterium]|nr:hypothetical protein [Gammaproteobacteria bacterium]
MRKSSHHALLMLAFVLSACSSTPSFKPDKDPYWMDLHWQASLLNSIQSVVHDPIDAADMSTPSPHASVKFTYADGVIEYPDIVESTGNPDLDRLLLYQVASAQPPKPTGPYAAEPHEFILGLD